MEEFVSISGKRIFKNNILELVLMWSDSHSRRREEYLLWEMWNPENVREKKCLKMKFEVLGKLRSNVPAPVLQEGEWRARQR